MQKIRISHIIIVGFIFRLAWVLWLEIEPVSDSFMYYEFSLMLFNEGVYAYPAGNLTAYWPVGTSAIIAGIYNIFGPSDLGIKCFNLAVSIINIYLIYRVTLFYFNPIVAKISAIFFILWPLMIQMTTVIASEMTDIMMCLVALLCWNMFRKKPLLQIVSFGVIVGLGCYIRPTIVLFVVIIPLIDAINYNWRISSRILSCVIVVVLLTAPWAYRNTQLFGSFTFISTNFGANLWMGNNINSDGGYMDLPEQKIDMNEKMRENILKQEAFDFIIEDPIRYMKYVMKRGYMSFKSETIGVAWNQPQLENYFSYGGIFIIKAISSLYWLIVFGLSLLGIVVYAIKNKSKAIFFHPMALYFYFMSIPLLIVGQDRYHIAMIPYVSMFAAYMVHQIILLIEGYKNKSISKIKTLEYGVHLRE